MAPSESSLKTYNAKVQLLKVAVGDNKEGFTFLKDSGKIISYIEGLKDASLNSKKTFYVSIVSLLKNLKGYTKQLKIYRSKMMEYNKQQTEIYDKQELSETEKAKWLSWPDILQVRQQVEDAVEDFKSFQDYLLLCIYTYIPPVRLDVNALKVVDSIPKTLMGNYYVNSKQPEILLTEYKTAAKYGPQHIKIPTDLIETINLYIELYEPTYLFENTLGEPMSEQLLSRNIINIFTKYTGKAAGINILRHAYVSQEREGELSSKKSKALANSMMHSTNMSSMYRRI